MAYDRDTLDKEFIRDQKAGKSPKQPVGYYQNDIPTEGIQMRWNLATTTFLVTGLIMRCTKKHRIIWKNYSNRYNRGF